MATLHHKRVRVGYRRYRIRGEGRATVKVHLAGNRYRTLKRAKKARLHVKTRATNHSHKARAVRSSFVVKVKKAKKR
jgi:hypothetical protein